MATETTLRVLMKKPDLPLSPFITWEPAMQKVMTSLKFPGIGPRFDDTGRIKDLLFEAAYLLNNLMDMNPLPNDDFSEEDWEEFRKLLARAKNASAGYEDVSFESEAELKQARMLLGSILETISLFCPPYIYFGTRGCDEPYGFWPDLDALQYELHLPERERCVISVPEGESLPPPEELKKRGIELVVVVNDHGNLVVYDAQGNELWSCV